MDFYIDLEIMNHCIESLHTMIENVDFIKKELLRTKEEISDYVWSGEGREAFNKAFIDWYRYMDSVYGYLQDTKGILEKFGLIEAEQLKKDCEAFVNVFHE